MRFIIILIVVLGIPSPGFSNTLSVPDDYATIQQAINAAGTGDKIVVGPGTYNECINFAGKAITVMSEQGAASTIIDGAGQYGAVVTCANGEGASSVLKGFTIINGDNPWGDGGGMKNVGSGPTVRNCVFAGNFSSAGGGMYNDDAAPTVEGCTFVSNNAGFGAGMYNEDSSPTVTDCTFSQNVADIAGGGMNNSYSNVTVSHSTFSQNSAFYIDDWGWPAGAGGGVSNSYTTSTFSDCTFLENESNWLGAGISNHDGNIAISGSSFVGNLAEDNGLTQGGAIYNGNVDDATIVNSTFFANAANFGGALYHGYVAATLTNCIFGQNTATEDGGALLHEGGELDLTNCTFADNSATRGGGALVAAMWQQGASVANSIFWNNQGSEVWLGDGLNPSTLTIGYSDVKGGQSSVYVEPGSTLSWGAGMIDSDPLFLDPLNGDCHLTYASPCIDAGDNYAPLLPATDFEGDSRIFPGNGKGFPTGFSYQAATVDMGADEHCLLKWQKAF